jgi:hypothetical protein
MDSGNTPQLIVRAFLSFLLLACVIKIHISVHGEPGSDHSLFSFPRAIVFLPFRWSYLR